MNLNKRITKIAIIGIVIIAIFCMLGMMFFIKESATKVKETKALLLPKTGDEDVKNIEGTYESKKIYVQNVKNIGANKIIRTFWLPIDSESKYVKFTIPNKDIYSVDVSYEKWIESTEIVVNYGNEDAEKGYISIDSYENYGNVALEGMAEYEQDTRKDEMEEILKRLRYKGKEIDTGIHKEKINGKNCIYYIDSLSVSEDDTRMILQCCIENKKKSSDDEENEDEQEDYDLEENYDGESLIFSIASEKLDENNIESAYKGLINKYKYIAKSVKFSEKTKGKVYSIHDVPNLAFEEEEEKDE